MTDHCVGLLSSDLSTCVHMTRFETNVVTPSLFPELYSANVQPLSLSLSGVVWCVSCTSIAVTFPSTEILCNTSRLAEVQPSTLICKITGGSMPEVGHFGPGKGVLELTAVILKYCVEIISSFVAKWCVVSLRILLAHWGYLGWTANIYVEQFEPRSCDIAWSKEFFTIQWCTCVLSYQMGKVAVSRFVDFLCCLYFFNSGNKLDHWILQRQRATLQYL